MYHIKFALEMLIADKVHIPKFRKLKLVRERVCIGGDWQSKLRIR